MRDVKSNLLVLSALLILVFAQVVSAEEITMELVANTTSDAYGDYTFIDIPNGNYQLVALKYTPVMGGKWLMVESDVVIGNGTDIINANLTLGFADPGAQDPVLSLLQRASISGKTLSTPMGGAAQNCSDVTVVLKTESGLVANTTSDVDGNYAFTDIPNGNYQLVALKYIPAMGGEGIWLMAESDIVIENGTDIVNADLTLGFADPGAQYPVLSLLQRASISGKTLSTPMGGGAQNYSDVTVVLKTGSGLVANTTSDVDGNYAFTDIPNGNYQLVALKYTPDMGGKWLMVESDIVIDNGQDIVNANLTLGFADPGTQDPVLSLLQRASISGKTLSTPMGGSAQNCSDVTVALLKQASEQPVPPVLSLPIAAFTVNVTSGDAPLNVAFTDGSTNATSWLWDFGDGENSTQSNPIHAYNSVGTYSVTLTATNVNGTAIEVKDNYITTRLPDVYKNKSIVFLVIGADDTCRVKKTVAEMGMDNIDVYGTYRLDTVESLFSPFNDSIDLSQYDIIFITRKGGMSFMGANLKPQILEMMQNKTDEAHVVDWNYGVGTVNHTGHPYLADYWDVRYDGNINRLITYLSVVNLSKPFSEYDSEIEIEAPSEMPEVAICHPDADDLFEDLGSYLEWYKTNDGTHHVYNPDNYTVGVTFFKSWDEKICDNVVKSVIKELEARGINVIPAYLPSVMFTDDSYSFFKNDDTWKVNAFIDLGKGVWIMSSAVKNTEYLQEANVPVINGIVYEGTIKEWENSSTGQDCWFQYQIPIMEIGGEIESIVVGGKEYDETLQARVLKPIDYQIDWMIDRTIRWMDLQRIDNEEKKVAIIYYAHGKAGAMVAGNLDVVPSIPNLLDAMNESGYDLDGMQPNRSEFLQLVLQQGRNIGVWAPGELRNMVENYDVELLPVETYMEWFNEIEPEARQSVIDTWGEPPGQAMVYENESGKYFVIPKITVGNILIAPQAARGFSQNDTLLYHDQTMPPSHQYIAFYLWLKNGYDADAIVHFGRHGTQEWLQGKGTSLSIKTCWPAILIQDMPVVYLYEVGGIGEGIMAKRRGNAVMVDHATPAIMSAGLYGNLTLLHDKMHYYETEEDENLAAEYKKSIIDIYADLNFEHEFNVSDDDLWEMNETEFDNFILYGPVHDYLHEIASEYMPYGLHILGEQMDDEGLIAMVKSMLGGNFGEHIAAANLCEDPDDLSPAHSPNLLDDLLDDVLVNGTDPMDLLIDRFNITYSSGEFIANTTCDGSGEYNFSMVKDGKYALYALKETDGGWLTGNEYITIQDGQALSGVRLNLSKNATGTGNIELEYIIELLENNPPISKPTGAGTIFGNITYSPMGPLLEVPNATVVVQKDNNILEVSISDSTGNYTFSNLPDGKYVVTAFYHSVSKYGDSWYIATKNVEIKDGTANNIDINMEKDERGEALNLNSLLGQVTGNIYSNETGNIVPECNVVLIQRLSDEQMMVVEDLNLAIRYAENIRGCIIEIPAMIDALDGKYIPPALGDDPLRSPEVLPTGKNFYAFNPNIVPTKESWNVGTKLVDAFLIEWNQTYGEYPRKVGFVLWSGESFRHKGVMESEILYMMGVKPTWDSMGKVIGVELIPEDELKRPRIDVVVTMTGIYRDNWKWQVQLMDRGARLAAQADNSTYDNYVKENSEAIYIALMKTNNYTEDEARRLSGCRVFGPDEGSWGAGGFREAVSASGTWQEESKLANLYIDSMSYAYGDSIWGNLDGNVFRQVLSDTDAVLFSRSGNDGRGSGSVVFDHVYEFFGGFGMAVREVSGTTPQMYIVNLKDPDNAVVETFAEFLARDLRAKYFNEKWIKGMMLHDYAGASEIDSVLEDFWGLAVTLPDEITDDMWKEFYDVYVTDKYDLGLEDWFDEENPWARQSMNARMLEAVHKGYWTTSDPNVVENLVREYVESVADNGVICCHHTCGNPLLDKYISGMLSVPGLSAEDIEKYRQLMDEATGRQTEQPVTKTINDDSSSSAWRRLHDSGTGNESTDAGAGAGLDTKLIQDSGAGGEGSSNPSDYVEGYEMQDESAQPSDTGPMSFSGADFLGMLIVVLAAGAIYIGFRRRGV
ncbi:MAG: PKD domain-containing protein [ANME-2 cluster archaeon]|nr:PKD domain-containing protein [ANME-2 cluster archaeon]MBC2747571.1 PKD domain-containing protein [ANME-2 cluster archaeon]